LVVAAQPLRAKFDYRVGQLTEELEHPFAQRHGQGYGELKDEFAAEFKPIMDGLIHDARGFNAVIRESPAGTSDHEQAQQGLDELGLNILLYRYSTRPFTTFYGSQFDLSISQNTFDQLVIPVSHNPIKIDLVDGNQNTTPIKTNLSRLAVQARLAYSQDPNNYSCINSATVKEHLVGSARITGETLEAYIKRRTAEFKEALHVLKTCPEGSPQVDYFSRMSQQILADITERQHRLDLVRRRQRTK
jgi:hypothetical protein